MFNISLYLEKFKDIQDPSVIKGTIKAIIEQETGTPLEGSSLSFEKNIITLRADAYMRAEIFMKREIILEKLKEKGIIISQLS